MNNYVLILVTGGHLSIRNRGEGLLFGIIGGTNWLSERRCDERRFRRGRRPEERQRGRESFSDRHRRRPQLCDLRKWPTRPATARGACRLRRRLRESTTCS